MKLLTFNAVTPSCAGRRHGPNLFASLASLAAMALALVLGSAGMAIADCARDALICPNREPMRMQKIPVLDLLGAPTDVMITVNERCDPKHLSTAVNSKVSDAKGVFPGGDHCGEWIVVAPNTENNHRKDGGCGDFQKGPACPAKNGM